MADYYRSGVTVTTRQSIINEILSFLTASGPGAAWTQDATHTVVGFPGTMFLASSGATTFYTYFTSATINSVDVLQLHYVPAGGAGFGAGTGPTTHFGAKGGFFVVDTTAYIHTLSLFATENRCIAILRSRVKAGFLPTAPYGEEEVFQTLYFGGYTSHAAAINDPYPALIAGNAAPMVYADQGSEMFPGSLAKRIGPSDSPLSELAADSASWSPALDANFRPARNSRAAEIFAYQQGARVYAPGREESLALTGLLVITQDSGIEQTITISAAAYYTWPAWLKIQPPDAPALPNLLTVIKGTVVP